MRATMSMKPRLQDALMLPGQGGMGLRAGAS